jgi:dihydrofolate reductase
MPMASVIANMSMSLDGFVADPSDSVDLLFGWYFTGTVPVKTADQRLTFQLSDASAKHMRKVQESVGAVICGRRLFDVAGGWGGQHPMGVPAFVVTHEAPGDWNRPDAPVTFVTDGVASAVEQAKATAGDKSVAIASADVTQQCLSAGLVDAIQVDLVPVLMGEGIRFFDKLAGTPVVLDDPDVVAGTGVLHLYYLVLRQG